MSADSTTPTTWSPGVDGDHKQDSDSGILVSASIPAPGLTVSSFLNQAEGQPRFFWQRDNEDALYAGFGTAAQLMAWGENRFREIEQKARRLFQGALILGQHSAPISPRLFGGFSFRDDFTPDNTWAVFHPAHFVLPHYQLVQKDRESWLTINALIAETEDLSGIEEQLHQALVARHRFIQDSVSESDDCRQQHDFQFRYPMLPENWSDMVNSAVQTIERTNLDKVVLARVCEIKSRCRINVSPILALLSNNYSDCTRFLFEPRPFHAFYGATPELLVRVEGKEVTTMALAGSMPRGLSFVEDESNAEGLLNSQKERLEHDLVVQAIRRRLGPITSELTVPVKPQIMRLGYIHHLLTPISGHLQGVAGILPLVQLLHPTPAMGGSPRDKAMDFIREYEPVPRGWYAAPVGWLDSSMDGEFVVAIRSAVAQERRVWCYAGAGIVAESQPAIEWAETDLKFRPMLQALGVVDSHRGSHVGPDTNEKKV